MAVAVPAATATVTVALADTARAAVATTRTVCAPPSSDTSVTAVGALAPSSKLNVTSSSSSKIFKSARITFKVTGAPEAEPVNRMV